jgi:hypothetical protein
MIAEVLETMASKCWVTWTRRWLQIQTLRKRVSITKGYTSLFVPLSVLHIVYAFCMWGRDLLLSRHQFLMLYMCALQQISPKMHKIFCTWSNHSILLQDACVELFNVTYQSYYLYYGIETQNTSFLGYWFWAPKRFLKFLLWTSGACFLEKQ